MSQPPWAPFLSAIDHHIGFEITHVDEGEVRAHFDMRPALTGMVGIIHGGVYASIAETVAGVGTLMAVAPEGKGAAGMSNAASFLRPISEGRVTVVARRRHRGRTTWIWDVEFTDHADRVCALVRMTLAVRPQAHDHGLVQPTP